jgi:hypothetical protein
MPLPILGYCGMLALMVSILNAVSFSACENEPEDVTCSDEIIITEVSEDILTDADVSLPEETVTVFSQPDIPADVEISESTTVVVSEKDLSALTKPEIVELYKNAAIKSYSSVTSQHSAQVTNISINGEELGGAFDFVKKIISSFISKNSEDTQGVTGGYKNLSEADVKSIKIYPSGKNTAIEIVLNEQVDGAKGDVQGGSVGHAIDVVGDISAVTSELTELGLPIEIPEESTSIHYTNPSVKVVVDENGKILRGTWRYTVDIKLKNYKAFGADVESSSIVMDNVITVGGGF